MACATPPTSSTKGRTNYARLCRLLVDIGTQALRDKFDAIHPPAKLHAVLAENKAELEKLRDRRILYPAQMDKLFPSDPTQVSSAGFDITLLTALFRNICDLSEPSKGWNNLPPMSDDSTAADIARVKYYRNTVYAHAERTSVDEAEFKKYWSDIRAALVRLGGTKYQKEIENLETACMDPETEDKYKDLLEEWQKNEEGITYRLDKLGNQIGTIKNYLSKLSNKVFDNGMLIVSL